MVDGLFNLKSNFFYFLEKSFWRSWIRIRIPNTDPDPGKPFQYRSAWMRSRIRIWDIVKNCLRQTRHLNFLYFFLLIFFFAKLNKKNSNNPRRWCLLFILRCIFTTQICNLFEYIHVLSMSYAVSRAGTFWILYECLQRAPT